jgi:hypothetical protein
MTTTYPKPAKFRSFVATVATVVATHLMLGVRADADPAGITAHQGPGGPGAAAVLSVSGQDGPTVWLQGSGFAATKVFVTNNGATPLTVTAIGTNPVLFTPISAVRIGPGEQKPIMLAIDMSAVNLPLSGPLFFETEDGTGIPAKPIVSQVSFSSKEVVLLAQKMVLWNLGENPATKTVEITNIPAGIRITGAKAVDPKAGFRVTLQGRMVSITPTSTATAAASPVQIETSPAAPRPVTFLAYIMPAAPMRAVRNLASPPAP